MIHVPSNWQSARQSNPLAGVASMHWYVRVCGLVVPIFLWFIFHFMLNSIRRVAASTLNWIFWLSTCTQSLLLFTVINSQCSLLESKVCDIFFSKSSVFECLSCYNSKTKSLRKNRRKILLNNFFALSKSVKTHFDEIGALTTSKVKKAKCELAGKKSQAKFKSRQWRRSKPGPCN